MTLEDMDQGPETTEWRLRLEDLPPWTGWLVSRRCQAVKQGRIAPSGNALMAPAKCSGSSKPTRNEEAGVTDSGLRQVDAHNPNPAHLSSRPLSPQLILHKLGCAPLFLLVLRALLFIVAFAFLGLFFRFVSSRRCHVSVGSSPLDRGDDP
jgi:hypothetical protein